MWSHLLGIVYCVSQRIGVVHGMHGPDRARCGFFVSSHAFLDPSGRVEIEEGVKKTLSAVLRGLSLDYRL